MADHPLRPANHLRLGRLLPHQLPNGTRAHPKAAGPKIPTFSHSLQRAWSYAVLASLSKRYPPPEGRLPTRYSPVRHFTRPKPFSFDLHVLSTPPAFVLSQDQTLQLILVADARSCLRHRRVCSVLSSRPSRPRHEVEESIDERPHMCAVYSIRFSRNWPGGPLSAELLSCAAKSGYRDRPPADQPLSLVFMAAC